MENRARYAKLEITKKQCLTSRNRREKNAMENVSNYQTLAMAIVAQALEDAEGSGQQSYQARQWLAMQQVIPMAGPGSGDVEYRQMCYSPGAPPQHRWHDSTPFRAKLAH